MDLLRLIQLLPFVPPLFNRALLQKYGVRATLPDTAEFPRAAFAAKRCGPHGREVPQAIAHRGCKTRYPENTIRAFQDAVNAGAHAIETDVHLTKDEVVVLSHDRDLKRCYGDARIIAECNWSSLESLRTVNPSHEPLACLASLLELWRLPEWEGVWLMLDIKIDDNPEQLVRWLADTFAQVHIGEGFAWKDRVLLGYWTAEYVPLLHTYFPGFSITNIGFWAGYSAQFLSVESSSFSVLHNSLLGPQGCSLARRIHESRREIYAWTVNDEKSMDWCIRNHLDGVVTDDVAKFLKLCEMTEDERRYRWSMKQLLTAVKLNMWIFLFGIVFAQQYARPILRIDTTKKKR